MGRPVRSFNMNLRPKPLQPVALDAETHFRADLDAIQQATSSLTSAHDVGEILDFILSVTASLLPADEMNVFLYADGVLTFQAGMKDGQRLSGPTSVPRQEIGR